MPRYDVRDGTHTIGDLTLSQLEAVAMRPEPSATLRVSFAFHPKIHTDFPAEKYQRVGLDLTNRL